MSLYIQTPTGLVEISDKITKEKIISALKYIPADEAHVKDTNVHVSSEDKRIWNNKSDFSGDYNDLINAPSIVENDSGDMIIADSNGNIIMKVDANGFETTTIKAKSAIVNNIDVTAKLEEQNNALINHSSNTVVHITESERQIWNNKSDFSGDYNDLVNAPDIQEDASGEITYADEFGNIIAKINENGFETTQVIANAFIAGGVDVSATTSSHVSNNDIHITKAERDAWNEKATINYVNEKIADLVDSAPETLDTLNELASALGDDPNFATTIIEQIGLKANEADLNTHINNTENPHNVTKSQIGLENVNNTSDANKPVSVAQQKALNDLKSELSESITTESNEWIIADEAGNIIIRINEQGLCTTGLNVQSIVINDIDIIDMIEEIVASMPSTEVITNNIIDSAFTSIGL